MNVWTKEDVVVLPELEGEAICHSLLSGEQLSNEETRAGCNITLRIADLLSHLPVAVIGVSECRVGSAHYEPDSELILNHKE
jgi:hypothetical protein